MPIPVHSHTMEKSLHSNCGEGNDFSNQFVCQCTYEYCIMMDFRKFYLRLGTESDSKNRSNRATDTSCQMGCKPAKSFSG